MISMAAEIEPTAIKDSDHYIKPVLANDFEHVSEGIDQERLSLQIIDALQPEHTGAVKVLSLVGGAGSGKSTLSRTLKEQLLERDYRVDSISTDDYNLGDRKWRWEHFEGEEVRDPMGKWDFEFMNRKIEAIKRNRDSDSTVRVPTYDSASGAAIAIGEENYTHEVGPLDVLIVEGDMFQVESPDLAIYLHTSDTQRLHNRIMRDIEHRNGGDVERITDNFNLRHYNQHLPYTLPAIHNAHIVVTATATENSWSYDLFTKRKL
jgi:uridine kinase